VTDDLIARLSADLKPSPRSAATRRLAFGGLVGALASAAFVVLALGVRPDIAQASERAMFWMKFAYGGAIGLIAAWAVERLARPAASARRRAVWLVAPLAVMTALATRWLEVTPPGAWPPLLMGHSAALCPWLILAASLPVLAGLVWAVRGLAPTRLRLTGLMVGLAAGGVGATAYALHCDEMAAPFLALWYSAGVALAAFLGWLTGPRLLRW
jgi:hypothetical protein